MDHKEEMINNNDDDDEITFLDETGENSIFFEENEEEEEEDIENVKEIPVEIILTSDYTKMPTQSYENSAGYDLYIPLPKNKTLTLHPHEEMKDALSLGFRVKIPNGYYGTINSRPGLACINGVEVIGAPTIIDPDFTGNVAVHLRNTKGHNIILRAGWTVAQLILHKRNKIKFIKTKELPKTKRVSKKNERQD